MSETIEQSLIEHSEKIGELTKQRDELLECLQALMGTCCHKVEWKRKWPKVVGCCYAAIAKATA